MKNPLTAASIRNAIASSRVMTSVAVASMYAANAAPLSASRMNRKTVNILRRRFPPTPSFSNFISSCRLPVRKLKDILIAKAYK